MSARRRDDSGEVLVARFNCTVLDPPGIENVRHELFALIEQRPTCKLLLNFRDVEYVSSAALGVFITLHRRLESGGGQLVLCFLSPAIHELLKLLKLDRLFNIEDDPAAEEGGVVLDPHHRPVAARKQQEESATGADSVTLPFPSPRRE